MKFETAPRTGKPMTRTHPLKATSGAYLAGVSGVNQSNLTFAFDLVSSEGKQHSSRPGMESPVPKSGPLPPLLKVQVLKDKDAVLRSPFDQLLGSHVTEVLGAASLLALKPFEGPSDALCTFALCLTGRKLLLKPLDGLSGSLIGDPPFEARDEKLSLLRVNRHKSVSLIKVNSDGKDTRCIWNFNGQSNVADKLPILNLHCDAVYFRGSGQHRLEVVGDGVVKTLSAGYRPDRKCAVLSEVSVPSALPNEKKRKRLLVLDRLLELVSIVLGRYISSCNEPNGGTSKLAGELSLDRVINSFMQGKCSEGLPFIPSFRGNPVANLYKGPEGCLEVFVGFYDYLSCPSNFHGSYIIPLTEEMSNE